MAKLYAYWITVNYREAYGIFACNGILFNHESHLRGENFVTRKITLGLAKLLKGQKEYIRLGNLNSERDWGHAKDYVEGMYLILQNDKPEDFVLSSGVTSSIRDFISKCFSFVKIDIEFEGFAENETGRITTENPAYPHLKLGDIVVKVDKNYSEGLKHFLSNSFPGVFMVRTLSRIF